MHTYAGLHPDTSPYKPTVARPMISVRNRLGGAAVSEPASSFLAHITWPFRPAGGSVQFSPLGTQADENSGLTRANSEARREDTGSGAMHFCLEVTQVSPLLKFH